MNINQILYWSLAHWQLLAYVFLIIWIAVLRYKVSNLNYALSQSNDRGKLLQEKLDGVEEDQV